MSAGLFPGAARRLVTLLLLSSCAYPHMSVVPDEGVGGSSGANSSPARGGVSSSAGTAGRGGAAGTHAQGGVDFGAGAAGVPPRIDGLAGNAGTTDLLGGSTSAGSVGVSGSTWSAGGAGYAGTQTMGGNSPGGSSSAGSPSGGRSVGGAANGGATAGAHFGGTTTGGATTVGTSGSATTGGATTGGAATGGAATGGTTTGGAATGGTTGGTAGAGGAGGTMRCLAATGSTPGTMAPGSRSCLGDTGSECHGESCCTAIAVPGGSFPMGRSLATNGTDYYVNPEGSDPQELPEHTATLAAFALDKYEVTVGRFRKFVSSYNEWHRTASNPLSHAGADPIVTHLGWGESWTSAAADLPSDEASLREAINCYSATFTTNAGGNELAPVNCVTWFIAQAFCLWDGGRLPTEAEWEYAAAGATLNRLYPWGAAAPDNTLAVYPPLGLPDTPVGSKPLGAGCFGHLDLAGSMWEWQFDWYKGTFYGIGTPVPCDNCVNYLESGQRAIRGGSWSAGINPLRPANRWQAPPSHVSYEMGIRCARRN